MSLSVRRDPFSEFGTIAKTLNDLNRAFNVGFPRFGDEGLVNGHWSPTVDVYEDQNGIVLEADLPGMKPGDFDLSIENNLLTLKGERKFEKKADEGNYHRVERSYGSFTRTFTLPSTVDVNNVAADFKDGVLKVALPRKEETKPRQIQVQVKTEADATNAQVAEMK
ncbi:MAG TPA: Hsp20/alpha crystallin family protein [Blastocatellia bacterium]|nr:Hsp20/alpha crystallin family protein [Blastocatellia bacterium]